MRRQVWISFDPGEHTMGTLTRFLPADHMICASDFPHSDAKYPGVVDELREHTAAMDDGARANLYGTNALRMYGLRWCGTCSSGPGLWSTAPARHR